MNRIPIIALAAVSTAALLAFVGEQPIRRVFAASQAQVQSAPVETAQPQQAGQSQQQRKGIVIVEKGPLPNLTPEQQLELQVQGLQMEVKALQTQAQTLQDQSASQQNSIHTLQSSLQTLQTQFNNHSHKVSTLVPGHLCTGLDTFLVTDAGTGQQRRISLQFAQPCSNPEWDGATPSSWESLNVSTPVQGAQTPQ